MAETDPGKWSRLTDTLGLARMPAVLTDTGEEPVGPRILYVNPAFSDLTGYPAAELVGQPLPSPDESEASSSSVEPFRTVLAQGEPAFGRGDIRCRNGSSLAAEWSVFPLPDTSGKTGHCLALLRELPDPGNSGDRESESLEHLRKFARNTPGTIYQFRYWPETGHACLPFATEGHEQVFGVPPEDVREDATPDFERIHPDDLPPLMESIEESARKLTPWTFQGRIFPGKDDHSWGPMEWYEGHATPEPMPDGSILWHGYITLITERKKLEQELQHLAYYDSLTGLPNRTLVFDRIGQAINRADRSGSPFALLYLDLDNFKDVNEGFGHETGDRLLTQVAHRLGESLRARDTVGRLGGDEVVVVAEGLSRPEDAETIAEKLLSTLRMPIRLDGQEFGVRTSIGIALYPDHGAQADEVLRNADAALHYAKRLGGNQWAFYRSELTRQAADRVVVEAGLRSGLERGEIRVAYQAIVRLPEETVIGYEALARWHHAREGWIPPERFIPVAEVTGLVEDIGRLIGSAATAEVAQWAREDGETPFLAVNVSPMQVRRVDFAESIRGMREASGLPAEKLELEITEEALLDLDPVVLARLDELRREGVRIAIDDFGTGFSSLSYLKILPVDRLKLDQVFVRDLATDAGNQAIAAAIVTLAQEFGLALTAEGVEARKDADKLHALGFREAQGFLFDRPRLTEPS